MARRALDVPEGMGGDFRHEAVNSGKWDRIQHQIRRCLTPPRGGGTLGA